MAEEWREIPGYPAYLVSSAGAVKRLSPRKRGRRAAADEQLQPGVHRGRESVWLTDAHGKRKLLAVQALVKLAFGAPARTRSLDTLPITAVIVEQPAPRKPRLRPDIPDSEARAIRRCAAKGLTLAQIAEQFNTSEAVVDLIVNLPERGKWRVE